PAQPTQFFSATNTRTRSRSSACSARDSSRYCRTFRFKISSQPLGNGSASNCWRRRFLEENNIDVSQRDFRAQPKAAFRSAERRLFAERKATIHFGRCWLAQLAAGLFRQRLPDFGENGFELGEH